MIKNWKLFICLMMLFLILLSGCHHDQKQAENIYTDLEKAADQEKVFADKQQALKETGEEEQTIYQKIMDIDTDHVEQLKQHIGAAQKNNEQQKQLLEEIDAGLNDAYQLSLPTKKVAEEIRDTEQQKLAIETVELMDKRYELFESYYKDFEDSLKESKEFYGQLQKEDRDTEALDKQIKKINKRYRKMEEQQDEFNRCTEQYNETKSKYYQAAGLTKHT
ncbi:chromosome segregation ATPase [Virgibacillus halotolerans]|uniref:YkyA family protein n=1 Tax=Virgibacillus halotolerans TaxID=1071053 RepID=UPI00195F51C8|nr:YkyA family protein [Virgibacillus halotolerans]MBM7600823.1 chromosome segregation ATPase [Virgibacillus halotolerans]